MPYTYAHIGEPASGTEVVTESAMVGEKGGSGLRERLHAVEKELKVRGAHTLGQIVCQKA